MKKLSWVFVVVMTIGLLMVSLKPAKATLLTFELGQGVITASFDDDCGDANTVRLTMTADELVDPEYIDDWYFNFNTALDPTQLSFIEVDVSNAKPNNISTGYDAFKADSYGWYDIRFDFPPPKGNDPYKFMAGEMVIYDITYIRSIDVSSFNFESSIVDGGFMSAAHIKGGSGWYTVPDATSVFLLGSACLSGFAGVRRTRKSSLTSSPII